MGEKDPMLGSVAVGVIVVDGKPGTDAEFSIEEMVSTITEMTEGYGILYSIAEGVKPKPSIVFEGEIQFVKLGIEPGGLDQPTMPKDKVERSAERAALEKVWRDPALGSLGFKAGKPGIAEHQAFLRSRKWTLIDKVDLALTVFVTKYPCGWYGYADKTSNQLVLQYSWLSTPPGVTFKSTGFGGWGANNIDRVFAHELGHLFGAPDEYAKSECLAKSKHGKLGIENGNCEIGNFASTKCLMRENAPVACTFTLGHWGWVDRNSDGVLDGAQ